jgi:hypothetical protein
VKGKQCKGQGLQVRRKPGIEAGLAIFGKNPKGLWKPERNHNRANDQFFFAAGKPPVMQNSTQMTIVPNANKRFQFFCGNNRLQHTKGAQGCTHCRGLKAPLSLTTREKSPSSAQPKLIEAPAPSLRASLPGFSTPHGILCTPTMKTRGTAFTIAHVTQTQHNPWTKNDLQ